MSFVIWKVYLAEDHARRICFVVVTSVPDLVMTTIVLKVSKGIMPLDVVNLVTDPEWDVDIHVEHYVTMGHVQLHFAEKR